jgi:hypothetical protein
MRGTFDLLQLKSKEERIHTLQLSQLVRGKRLNLRRSSSKEDLVVDSLGLQSNLLFRVVEVCRVWRARVMICKQGL